MVELELYTTIPLSLLINNLATIDSIQSALFPGGYKVSTTINFELRVLCYIIIIVYVGLLIIGEYQIQTELV